MKYRYNLHLIITATVCTLTLSHSFLKTKGDIGYISNNHVPVNEQIRNTNREKEWNFIVYFAGNNNLYRYVDHNLKQMMRVGSNDRINVLAQIDQAGKKITKRVEVHKGHLKTVSEQPLSEHFASGTKKSLYSCLKWAITQYPAKHHALVLWNHGSGIIDPHRWGRFIAEYHNSFFRTGPQEHLSLLHHEVTSQPDMLPEETMGIAFNDNYCEYLTNEDLSIVLSQVTQTLLGGKKLDLIGMDACNMAMIEIGSQIKQWCSYLVASQEVELGPGWNYEHVLTPLSRAPLTPEEFSRVIVEAYKKEYMYLTDDFTQSALSLENLPALESNINAIAERLMDLLNGPQHSKAIRMLREIRTSSKYTTYFYDNNYIDLHHFYISLLNGIKTHFNRQEHKETYEQFTRLLNQGIYLVYAAVLCSSTGSHLINARGISIYFPTRMLHSSYHVTLFGKNNSWKTFIDLYLKTTR